MDKYALAKKLLAEEAPKNIAAALAKGEIPNGWDIKTYPEACRIANTLTLEHGVKTNDIYLACDYGTSRSPRYEVIKAPKAGEPCSKGFNGDRYPCGYIKSVSDSFRVITTDGGLRFYRKKLTGAWIQSGGTWGLIQGHVSSYNREF